MTDRFINNNLYYVWKIYETLVIVIYVTVLIDTLFKEIDHLELKHIQQKNVFNIENKNDAIVVENYVYSFYITSRTVLL